MTIAPVLEEACGEQRQTTTATSRGSLIRSSAAALRACPGNSPIEAGFGPANVRAAALLISDAASVTAAVSVGAATSDRPCVDKPCVVKRREEAARRGNCDV